MTKYIKEIGIAFAVLSTIGFLFYQFQKKNEQIEKLKGEVIEKSELIKEKDGLYSNIVNDLNTEKQLKQKIENELKELSVIIKERNEKPVQIIEQVLQMPFRIDTVEVYDTIINEKDHYFAEFFYPDQDDYFAHTRVQMSGGIGVASWHFEPLELNLTITQTESGLFNSYMEGPEWIVVKDLQVNTLPMQPQFPEKPYKFYLGGGLGYIEGFKFYTSGSVKYKDHMIDLNLFGFSGITLGYKRPL